MIELVSRDLHHDLEAYRDFCSFRDVARQEARARPSADRERWLEERRETLQERMHKRRERDLDGSAAAAGDESCCSLFGL